MTANPNKDISQTNLTLLAEIERIVQAYPLQKQKLQTLLGQLHLDQDTDQQKISKQVEKIFNLALMNVLKVQIHKEDSNWEKKCGLPEERINALKDVLEVVCNSQEGKVIRRSLVITFIENILECLGVSDLTQVLTLISEHICSFASSLEEKDQNKLLRIINHLLKRISKTEDYHIRGQLHFTLTKFLPICHDSGFNYRSVQAKASEWEKINSQSSELNDKNQLALDVTYQFYEQFWEMQNYFMDLNELTSGQTVQATPNKSGHQSLISVKLKRIEQTLKEVDAYFTSHKAKQTSDYYNQPLKFLKNFNLLALQLSDPFFRKIIMLQTLIFCFSLCNQSGKSSIILGQTEKKILSEIQNIGSIYLKNKCGQQGKVILEEMMRLLNNELYWIDLKDNWKDKKKSFFKKQETIAEEEAKHKVSDIERKRADIRRQINEKLKIDGNNLLKFIQNKEPISLQMTPSSTSFSYFYSQSLSCLNSFDQENGKQTEYETRSQYNMFEWKAMRSLYRQNLNQIWSTDKCPTKMKQYRLISLMHRKAEQLTESQPRKKVKQE